MFVRSTTEAIYVLRRLIEKYREWKKDFNIVFIDLASFLKDRLFERRHFIFDMTINELWKSMWEIVSWCMLFADDIVLEGKSIEEVITKLEEWKGVLKGKGVCLVKQKHNIWVASSIEWENKMIQRCIMGKMLSLVKQSLKI